MKIIRPCGRIFFMEKGRLAVGEPLIGKRTSEGRRQMRQPLVSFGTQNRPPVTKPSLVLDVKHHITDICLLYT